MNTKKLDNCIFLMLIVTTEKLRYGKNLLPVLARNFDVFPFSVVSSHLINENLVSCVEVNQTGYYSITKGGVSYLQNIGLDNIMISLESKYGDRRFFNEIKQTLIDRFPNAEL